MKAFFVHVLLYVVVFATGAAGLVYQVTWQKYLSRLLGSDTIATAIILSSFLGGLSFGYYLCGKITTRVKNFFKGYAFLEGIIGVWGLCFPLIFETIASFTRHWSFSPPLLIIVQGFFCSALILGVPTVCMGGTIPFLTRGVSRNVAEATFTHAKIYAINTSGAVIGTLLAGFYLIPYHGLPLTVMGTALLNLAAGLFFYFISKWQAPVDAFPPTETPIAGKTPKDSSTSLRFPPCILYFIAFLSGLYVMTLENVFIRITNISLGSSSYSFALVVSVFILSIAVGSYGVSRLKQIPTHLLFMNQLFITLLLIGIYTYLDTWPYWAHVVRITFQSNMAGFWGYCGLVFLALTLILIFPVGLMGATVPIAFHEIKRDLNTVGKYSGTLFAWNTAGNLIGSLIGGIVLYYFFNNSRVFLSAVMLAALSTCLVGRHLSKRYFVSAILLAGVAFYLIVFVPFYNEKNFVFGGFQLRDISDYSLKGPKRFFKETQSQYELTFYKDGPASTVAVIETPLNPSFNQKSRSIVINGKSDSSTIGDIYTLKLLAHLPALLAEKRENVLVIGLGTGVTAGELTLYPDIRHIDVAEISPSVVEALPYFKDFTNSVHKDARVRISIGDAFRILGRSRQKWDIIVSEPSNPWVTGVDLLFTQEFYQLSKEHLTENGVLVQWAQIYAASPQILGMIVNTVRQEFKQSRLFLANSGDLLLLASNKGISLEDLKKAEGTLSTYEGVRSSLSSINLISVDSILIREIWPPSYMLHNFAGFGIQTLDFPRLHYMAGKRFFIGEPVPDQFLFNASLVAYLDEFLMVKKHKDWKKLSFSRPEFDALFFSTKNKPAENFFPMAKDLKLKAYLGNPDLFPLADKEKEFFKTELIPFIVGGFQKEKDWEKIGLGYATFQRKAQALLDHVDQFRSWIVPYPIEGLKSLLQEGVSHGKDVYEKNWCTLQLALLLLRDGADKNSVAAVLDQSIKGPDGRIFIREWDRKLLPIISQLMNNSREAS